MKRGARVGVWLNVAIIAGTAVLFAASTISERTVRCVSRFKFAVRIYSVVFSPDGSRFAATHQSQPHFVRGQRTLHPGTIFVAPSHGGETAQIAFEDLGVWPAFARDGQSLILPHPNELTVAPLNGSPRRKLPGLTVRAFSQDGKYAVGTKSDAFRLVDLKSGKTHDLGPSEFYWPAFTPDGAQIFGVSDRTKRFHLWKAESGKAVAPPSALRDARLSAAAVSPDGRVFAAVSTEGRLHLVDSASGAALPSPSTARTVLDRVFNMRLLDGGRFLVARGTTRGPHGPQVGHQIWDLSGNGRNWLFMGERNVEQISSNGLCALRERVTEPRWQAMLRRDRSRFPQTTYRIVLLDLRTGRERSVSGTERVFSRLTFSPYGDLLAVATENPREFPDRGPDSTNHQKTPSEVAIYRMPRR